MKQVALITGSSRGIGKATALRLAEDGYDIVVNFNRSEKQAMKLVDDIKAKGGRSVAIKADVSKWSGAKNLVNATLEKFGRLDILVNNAGVYVRDTLDDLTPSNWDVRLATNLSSMFYCTKAALQNFRNLGHGRIINISSQIGFRGTDHGAEYAASKAGIIGFTKAVAQELCKHNVTVNAIAPGAVDTDILAEDTPERKRERAREIPMGRLGTPEDIAAVVSFLASEEADWITGATIHVNGGSIMY